MSEVRVLIEIQGGCCQAVFVQTEGVPENDVKVGIIDWDVFDTVNEAPDPEEFQETVGWLAAHDPIRTMNEETQEAGRRIFEENPMTVQEFRKWAEGRNKEHGS